MSTRLTIVRLVAVAGLSVSLTACGKLTAQKSFKDGINAYQQQNYREAIQEFEEAVQTDFEYRPYAYFYLANAHDNAFKYSRKGQPENDAHLPEAEKYYRLAFDTIDPASREGQGAIFKKRSLEYLVGLYTEEKLNNPEQALEVGQQIVALDPKDVNNYFGLSKLYKDAGRMEEAEQMLMRAKEVAPNADYIKRGLEAADKAIGIKGDYVDAMVMKNLLLRQQALVEKSPAKQQELLKEATAIREKAIETRNRLQGEADAATKAAAEKKSE